MNIEKPQCQILPCSSSTIIPSISAESLSNFLTTSDQNDDDTRQYFILDCRSRDQYQNLHIFHSYHVTLPTILYKRLLRGTLQLQNSLFADESIREKFSRLYKTVCLVLVVEDYFEPDLFDKNTDIVQSNSLASLLYKKLIKDGCNVVFLKGGFNSFNSLYPHLCQSSFSSRHLTKIDHCADKVFIDRQHRKSIDNSLLIGRKEYCDHSGDKKLNTNLESAMRGLRLSDDSLTIATTSSTSGYCSSGGGTASSKSSSCDSAHLDEPCRLHKSSCEFFVAPAPPISFLSSQKRADLRTATSTVQNSRLASIFHDSIKSSSQNSAASPETGVVAKSTWSVLVNTSRESVSSSANPDAVLVNEVVKSSHHNQAVHFDRDFFESGYLERKASDPTPGNVKASFMKMESPKMTIPSAASVPFNLDSGCAISEAASKFDQNMPSPTYRKRCLQQQRHFPLPGDSRRPVEIVRGLFLGNSTNAADRQALRNLNISYVLNVTPDLPNVFERDASFRYLQLPIYDHWSQDLLEHFPRAIAFIDEARRNGCGVLVHCLAGISRSVTVTVAYLMSTLSLSLEDAYELVKRHKPNIAPNLNFMGQLLDFQRRLYGENVPPPVTGLQPILIPDDDLFQENGKPLFITPLSDPPMRRRRGSKPFQECF